MKYWKQITSGVVALSLILFLNPFAVHAALIYGNALQFDGSTNYAQSANGVGSTVTDNFSMSCWVNITASTGGSAAFFQNGANDARGMELRISATNVFSADYAFVAAVNSGVTLNTGTWYHVGVIRNAGTSQAYVNGVAQGSTSGSAPNSGGGYITIGADSSSAGAVSHKFNGKVDDCRFYERAISSSEMLSLYNNGNIWPYTDISNTSLKFWYKMDETSGTNVSDSASSVSLTTTGSPSWVQGIVATGSTSGAVPNGVKWLIKGGQKVIIRGGQKVIIQ